MGFGFKVLAGFSQFFVLVSEVNFFCRTRLWIRLKVPKKISISFGNPQQ